MQSLVTAISGSIALLVSMNALAQTPAEIFQQVDQRQRGRLAGIQNYTLKKSTIGLCSLEHFQKETAQSLDGRGAIEYMRMMSLVEVSESHAAQQGMPILSANDYDRLASLMPGIGDTMEREMRREASGLQLPGGIMTQLLSSPSDKPWLSANPSDIMGMYATMFEAAADGKREVVRQQQEAEQEARTDPMAALANNTHLARREIIRQREAFVLVSDGFDFVQQVDGEQFTLNKMTLWVDTDDYIPLKMSFEGVAVSNGQSRQLKIEREDMEHRKPAGCGSFIQPFRTVMRIAGIMTPDEQTQMTEAQQQMIEMRAQIDSMPPEQKAMIMRRMGPQIEMMESMAAGNGVELVSQVVAMRCNAGIPTQTEYMETLPGNMLAGCGPFDATSGLPANRSSAGSDNSPNFPAPTASSEIPANSSNSEPPELVRMAQESLASLGFDPGNTDGDISNQTVRAILQFQDSRKIAMTGKVTPQLVGKLQAEIDARN